MKICLDPGHGGHDPGAVGPTGLKEAYINLEVSQLLAMQLEARFQTLCLTRSEDIYVELTHRCQIANSWPADIFVSVHCNSDGSSAAGIECLYVSTRGEALSTPIQAELIRATGDVNRGLKYRSDLAVLNGTEMPATLVEIGFISNPDTELLFKEQSYLVIIAKAIAIGIETYFGHKPQESMK